MDKILNERLLRADSQNRRRVLRELEGPPGPVQYFEGRELLNFCSNNYLGLAGDPRVLEGVRSRLKDLGAGAAASRLVGGSHPIHRELEARLAALKGTEACLVYPSGYQAGVGVISALMGRSDQIIADKLVHACLLDGVRLSGAELRRYPHLDIQAAREFLSAPAKGQRLLLTESVFSMDGDVAPLREMVELAKCCGVWLMVDEAHATGVFGARGEGLAAELGVAGGVDIQMGTLSKALGSQGGYVAGSRALIDTLVNSSRAFIYTTGLSPLAAAAALSGLEILGAEPERRERLWKHTRFVCEELGRMGWETGRTQTPIVPVILGEAGTAVACSEALWEQGIYVQSIRPPTVPEGTSRLRITLMATHTEEHLERLLEALRRLGKEKGLCR
ncbi:MAG: 8-amino-7-oxononanoate synthase [Candidatus Omnitrophica bacterium]|nr:8-amino-7-oxononanoate synthase [Candidatus Omnitrophota bacterium]